MFNFFKRKKKKQEEIDQSFAQVMEEIHRIDDWENPKKIRHYILDSCQQIVSRTKIVDKEKAQYRVLSKYMDDIRKLSSLNQRQSKALRDVINKLDEAKKAKEDYVNVTHRLHEDQYLLLGQNARFIPQEILQMQENETYQYSLKRDMQVLEGSKSEYEIEREKNRRTKAVMRKVAVVLLSGCATFVFLFLVLQFAFELDTTWASLALLFFMVVFVFGLFYKNSNITRENRMAVSELNRTISLLNVVRMKYANVTSSITYIQKKYHIRTSYELSYLWEAYNEEKKIRDKNKQDNEDYRFFFGRLVKMLNMLELNDSDIWLEQTEALVDENEMAKVRSSLTDRRSRLRDQIMENTRVIQEERDEIARLMREHDYYPAEIVELVGSVDRMCGLNLNYHFRTI